MCIYICRERDIAVQNKKRHTHEDEEHWNVDVELPRQRTYLSVLVVEKVDFLLVLSQAGGVHGFVARFTHFRQVILQGRHGADDGRRAEPVRDQREMRQMPLDGDVEHRCETTVRAQW